MGKTLVIVYSYTGTARRAAQLLCAQQQWPLAEIGDAEPRRGWTGTLRCVLDSLLRRRPAITYQGPRPAGFDRVVLVAPIWMQRLAGPMRSFVASRALLLPDLAVVSVMGSRGAPRAVAEIAALTGRTPLLDTALTSREVDDGSLAARLQAFGDALQRAGKATAPERPVSWSTEAV